VGTFPIQPYDMVMLAVLAVATLFGLWKGMAWQLASVASVVVSFVVAVRMSAPVAPMISAQEPWNRFIAMLLLYLVSSAVIWLVFRLVAGIIDRVRLKDFDHQIGALFGLAKGALLCLVITFFAVTLSESLRQTVLKTYSGHYIAVLIKQTSPIMPPEVRKVLGTYIDELDRKLDPAAPPDAPSAPQRAAIPLTAELPRVAEQLGIPQRPIWDWQGQPSAAPATPAQSAPQTVPAPRAEYRSRDAEPTLFPVKLPSRDRT
jgi:membrane protein required for colicin V production